MVVAFRRHTLLPLDDCLCTDPLLSPRSMEARVFQT